MKYNNQIKKGIDDIKEIKMSSEERENIFNNLSVYMRENPIKEITFKNSLSHWLFAQTKVHRYAYYSIAFILTFGIIGGNIMYAAEKALPGDVLYPVKINVNEKVKSVVAITPKAKAELEEKKVVKRLDEVKALIEKDDFDDKKRETVEKELEKSVKVLKINKEKKINKKDDDFKDRLDIQLKDIKKVDTDKSKNKTQREEVKKFEDKIKSQLDDFMEDKDDDEKDIKSNKD